MSAIALSESTRIAAVFCAAAVVLTPFTALALDRPSFGASAPATRNPCVSHGPGFESVGGTCVKIGGRVHVEGGMTASNWRVAPAAGAATRSAAPDFGGIVGAPSHLRLPRRY